LFLLKIITKVDDFRTQANGVLQLGFYLWEIRYNIENKNGESCLKGNLLPWQNIFLKIDHIYHTELVFGVSNDYIGLLRELS